MYKPQGKIVETPLQEEETSSEQSFVPPVQYDNLLKDKKVYQLRSTLPVPSYVPSITQAEQNDRVILRYFVQHRSSGEVLEVSEEVYNSMSRKQSIYHYPSYILASSPWRIQGPVANQNINGYIVEGASKENEFYIEELQKRLPNIRTYLTDPSQFVK